MGKKFSIGDRVSQGTNMLEDSKSPTQHGMARIGS